MGRLRGFTHDGLMFDVRDRGPDDGDTVVLLHGFPQDGSCWDAVAARLHDDGLRTLVPDQRGYSPGARPPATSSYRLDALTDDVVGLLDAAEVRRAHVVGHDWGGLVAWGLAARVPERVHTVTIASTPHPQAMARALRGASQAMRSWYVAAFQIPRLPEVALPRTLRPGLARSGMPPEDQELVLARLRDPAAVAGALAWYRALRSGPRTPVEIVRVPTTFVWGRHDPFLGRLAAELTRGFVSAPYRFVELDAGHWLPQTRPLELSTVLLDRIRTVAAR